MNKNPQFCRTTAIAGIGATSFSKFSGRSELQLAAEAVTAAIRDAGLTPNEVDGLVTFSMDQNLEIQVARCVGIKNMTHFSRIHYGGGAACATVLQAASAVASGEANVVVCYRALNERSGMRYGTGIQGGGAPAAEILDLSWYIPFGFLTPAAWVAMFAQRYMYEFGATSEDFGRVSVVARKHAATNPNAFFYQQPITLADHQASRWIAEPLHLLDCCQESDGAQAIVVVSAERARDLPHKPAIIAAAAQGSAENQHILTSYYRADFLGLPELKLVAERLFQQADISLHDIQTAILYDHFTPFVLWQLEELGFCARGEAKDFIKDGNITMGGKLPINTHGGLLGEAYIHGMNGIGEGVRQIRGTAVNQVPSVKHVLVTSGTGVPTSCLILAADH